MLLKKNEMIARSLRAWKKFANVTILYETIKNIVAKKADIQITIRLYNCFDYNKTLFGTRCQTED